MAAFNIPSIFRTVHILKSLVSSKQHYSPSFLFMSQKCSPLVSILSESQPVTNASMFNAETFPFHQCVTHMCDNESYDGLS